MSDSELERLRGEIDRVDERLLTSLNERARLAYDVYIHRLRSAIAAMVAAAGGIDALVFTGGVGEHSARVRDDARRGLPLINRAQVLVIEAREDLELARQATELL